MGDYAIVADVTVIFKANAALDFVVVGDDILDPYIDAREAQINAALETMEYPTIPLTGTGDIALIKRQVARVVAGDIYQEQYPFTRAFENLETPSEDMLKLMMQKADNLLKLAQTWQQEFLVWLASIENGDIRFPDSEPDARTKGSMRAGYIDYNFIQTSD